MSNVHVRSNNVHVEQPWLRLNQSVGRGRARAVQSTVLDDAPLEV